MKRLIYALLLVLLVSPLFAAAFPAQAQSKKVGIDLTPGRVKDIDNKWSQKLLKSLEGNLTQAGYEVVELTSITPETLADLDALVIGKMYNEESGFSQAEVQAIAEWFKQGGKFLWVGADSDYTEPYLNPEDTSFKAKEPNKILEAIGSSLRIDYMSVEDPENNAGASYRVVANRSVGGINSEGKAAALTAGVDRLLFHGPAGVVGYKDGAFVPPEEVFSNDVFWVARTGEKGTVVSHDAVEPQAYDVGYTGRLYLAVAEEIQVGGDLFTVKYSKVIVTAESLIGDRNIFNSEYHGITFQGPKFTMNVFAWGLTERTESNMTGYVIVGVVIMVVIAAVALFITKKK